MDETSNPIMRIYYSSRPVLFGMCAGNEIFYASLYLLHFTSGPFYIFNITAVLCLPVAMAKLAIALFQVSIPTDRYVLLFFTRSTYVSPIPIGLPSMHEPSNR